MENIIVQLQNDLKELQQLLLKYSVNLQETIADDQNLLIEKSIYIENTYTLEDLQAEGLNNIEIINCLESVGIVLGYSALVRGNTAEAIDHFMMALHYNLYSKDALNSLLDLFIKNMEEKNRSLKVYELLSQMYDFTKKEDKEFVIDCALETGFIQLCNEITIQEAEK